MGNKKPAPREGRVVLAQVVKLVNTGGCHPPGICSHKLQALRVRVPSWAPQAPVIIIVNGLWLVNKKPAPQEGRVVLAQVVKLVNAGDCQSPGICSHKLQALRVRVPSWAPQAPAVIIVNGLWLVNKKPAPREGRVVLAQVVKLVNTGGCHPPGICSKTYKPYGFESRPGHHRHQS